MTTLAEAVAWKIDRMRDELDNAVLTDVVRMQGAILVHALSIGALITPSIDQAAKLKAVELNAETLTVVVRGLGPDPSNTRIRKTFDALRLSVDELAASLHDLVPSDLGGEKGLS